MITNKPFKSALVALTMTLGMGFANSQATAATPAADLTPPTIAITPEVNSWSDSGSSSDAIATGLRDYAKLGMAGWKIHARGKQVKSGSLIKLSNTVSGSFMAWKHQRFGVDLGWHGHHKASIKLIAKRGGVIRYGKPIAIWVADKPGKNRRSRHLYYKKSRWGINIGWHAKPKFDWQIGGGKRGSAVKPGAQITITNKTAARKHKKSRNRKLRADLVFCARNKGGAWLKWGHDCSKADRARTRFAQIACAAPSSPYGNALETRLAGNCAPRLQGSGHNPASARASGLSNRG